MATVDEIAVKLGLQASEFKAALKSAGAEIQTFKDKAGPSSLESAFDGLSKKLLNLKGLGGAVAVALGINFQAIAESAARAFTDLSVDAEKAFERIIALGNETTEIYRKIFSGSRSDQENLTASLRAQNTLMNERTAILDAQAARIKRIQQADSDSTPLLIEQNRRKLEEERIRLAEIENQLAKEQVTIQEKQQAIAQDQLQTTEKEERELTQTREENARKEAQTREKESAESRDEFNKRVQEQKELHDLKLAALPPDKQLVQLAEEKLDIELKIQQQRAFGLNTVESEVQLQKNINQQKQITDAVTKSTAKTEEQITQEKIKQLTAEKNRLASIQGIRGGNQFNDASDATLQEISRRNRNQAQAMGGGQTGSIGRNLEVARLLSEALNAEKELAFRRNFRSTVDLLGEQGARSRFAGDPLQFDRVLEALTTKQDKSTNLLQSLDDRLQAAGFGRR